MTDGQLFALPDFGFCSHKSSRKQFLLGFLWGFFWEVFFVLFLVGFWRGEVCFLVVVLVLGRFLFAFWFFGGMFGLFCCFFFLCSFAFF